MVAVQKFERFKDMTKYATQRKYQPYIDAVMDDLGLTGKVTLEFVFRQYKTMGGDVDYNNVFKTGKIRIDSTAEHKFVIETIMHELRHIWQVVIGIRKGHYLSQTTDDDGEFEWLDEWKGIVYHVYNHAVQRNHKQHKLYMASPWEVDARNYEKKLNKLFPNCEVKSRKLVGVVGKVTFHKIAA